MLNPENGHEAHYLYTVPALTYSNRIKRYQYFQTFVILEAQTILDLDCI